LPPDRILIELNPDQGADIGVVIQLALLKVLNERLEVLVAEFM